jgi:nitroreductase
MTNVLTMTNPVIESLVSRSTTSHYDPAVTLTDEQIRELVRIATTAPTSFHLQNWRFIAVRTPEAKARLQPIAWGQPKITAAAVTFIICGLAPDHEVVRERLAPVVEAGIMPAEMVVEYEDAARRLYFGRPQCQRDEAIRTGTIAATALMYAANALGLGSTPMIAFDPEPLAREFGLADDEVPVMLVAVGAKLPTNWPQKPRRPVADVLELV